MFFIRYDQLTASSAVILQIMHLKKFKSTRFCISLFIFARESEKSYSDTLSYLCVRLTLTY